MAELPEGFKVVSQPDVPEGFSVVSQPEPVSQPESDVVSRGLLQHTAQGASFGFSDELTAALAAIPAAVASGTSLKDAFDSILEAERLSQDQYAEEHPVASTLAQVGGGLGTGGLGAAKIAGAKVFQGGKTIASRTGKKLAAQATTAAPLGALYGAGVAEGGAEERAKGAVEGAAISAAATPFLAAAAGGGSRAVKAIANRFSSKESREYEKGIQQIARAVGRDSDTADEILMRSRDLGPEGTLVDAGKVNMTRELERAASVPGQAPEITEKFLVGRLSRAGVRIQQVFDKYVGKSTKNAVKTVDDIGTAAATKAAPFYTKAYATKVNNQEPRLASLLNNPRIKAAIPKAIDRIKSKSSDDDEMLQYLQAELKADNPNMILWDHVKRQLDDDASAAFRRGENSLGSDISKNAKTLRDALDVQSPEYRKAREIWSGSSRATEAFEDGLNFDKGLNNPLTGAAAKAARFKDLSQSEKELFRKGVSTRIRQMVRTAGDTVEGTPPASLAKKIWGNKEVRAIINTVIPDKQGRTALRKALNSEAVFRQKTNEILRNSKTALRQELLKEPSAELALKAQQSINLLFAIRGSFFAMGRAIESVVKTRPPAEGVNTQVAKQLSAKGEAAISGIMDDVNKYLTLPKETGNAISRLMKTEKGKRMEFLRANPQIKKEVDRVVGAYVAALYASGKVKPESEGFETERELLDTATESLNLETQ